MNMHNIHFVIYSVAFLYTIRGVKTTIPFEIASKRIKYQGINLTKEAKDLYTENCKVLIKEIEEVTSICHVHELEILILLMSILSNQSTDSMQPL